VNFREAIKSGYSNYVNFEGRASRSEFWFFVLFYFIAFFVLGIADQLVFWLLFEVVVEPLAYLGFGRFAGRPLTELFVLATLLPSIAVVVRRLHDLDRSGWFILLNFVPFVGQIVLIVWYCGPGTKGPNRFGPEPP
jgi:uncharacterized membrane protein YhaH (DUF805 family)